METTQTSSPEAVEQATPISEAQPSTQEVASQASPDVSGPTNDASTAPAKEGTQSGQSGKNWEQEFNKLNAQQSELRRKLVSQGTEKNTYAKQLSELQAQNKAILQTLADLTKTPYDPDEFMAGMRTGGPKFLEEQLKGALEARESKLMETSNRLQTMVQSLVVEREYEKRVADTENYPGFKERESTMEGLFKEAVEAFDTGKSAVDPRTMDPKDLYDQLYTLAGPLHSQNALKKAEAHGKAQAEAQLATESATTVATGGKHVGKTNVDPTKMSLKDHRQFLLDQGLGQGF